MLHKKNRILRKAFVLFYKKKRGNLSLRFPRFLAFIQIKQMFYLNKP